MTVRLIRTMHGGWSCAEDPGEPGYEDRRARWSVTGRECAWLGALARNRSVLEIGTGLGVSTRAMASTAQSVITVDVDPWVKQHIASSLPMNVRLVTEIPSSGAFDLAFIDGCHRREAVAADIEAVWPLMRAPGLVVLHDLRIPQVAEGVDMAMADYAGVATIDTECGLGLLLVAP